MALHPQKKRYLFELKNKVSGEYVRELVSKRVVSRIPGVSLIYSELVEGVPPIFAHGIPNISHIHSFCSSVCFHDIHPY
jgi:KUP system potassium uptake protein